MKFLKFISMNLKYNIYEKHLQKKKNKTNVNNFFIAVLLHFYDLNYLHKFNKKLVVYSKIGHGALSNFDSIFKNGHCHQFFRSLSLKMTKLEGGGEETPPPNVK